MLLPPSILNLVRLVERLKDGLDIDEAWVEGPKAKEVKGKFALPNQDKLTMECSYKLPDGTPQKVEAVYQDGPNNNEITIDGTPQKVIHIKLKPDFDTTIRGVTVELEAALKYKDTSDTTRSIKLSSERIKLL